MKRRRPAPLLDSATFVWHAASSHSDVAAFAERQRQRMKRAQDTAAEAQSKTLSIIQRKSG